MQGDSLELLVECNGLLIIQTCLAVFIWTHWRDWNLPAEAVTESSVWALFTLVALEDFTKTAWLSLMNRAAHPSNLPFLFPQSQKCCVLLLMKCRTKHSWQHTLSRLAWFLDDLQLVELCQVIFVKLKKGAKQRCDVHRHTGITQPEKYLSLAVRH